MSHKGILAMPGMTSKEAPTFSGVETLELLEFFDYFEELADKFELTDSERWFGAHDYKKFKASILDQYPGASKGIKYTVRDLGRLMKASRDDEITSETELLQYYRKFRPIAVWLVTNHKIGEGERDHYFWYGLHPSTRHQISRRLKLEDPENYTRSEAADMDKVLAAGRFIFSDEALDEGPIGNRDWDWDDDEEWPEEEIAEWEVRTRKVALEGRKSTIDEVEELAKKLHGLQVHDVAYSGYYARLVYLAPAVAQHWTPPRSCQNTALTNGNPA
ncbi:hypothetical protein BD779DRAFT_1801800 [Infundibulicybe gibba]|nr:hypothetical protein BD779DRAFT_1801800 [Infundibulicybe gibba]